MSLDKAIKYGKEKRKPYYGMKAIDPLCRNHRSDEWAKEDRLHKFRKNRPTFEEFDYEDNDENWS